MKKKKIVQVITLVAALTIFTVTALASSVKSDGYETFKDTMLSMKNMKTMNNGTLSMTMEISDNGEDIANIEGQAKVDHESKNMSGAFTFTVNDTTKSIEMYKNDETHIIVDKINDAYYQIEKPEDFDEVKGRGHGKFNRKDDEQLEDREMTPQQEALIDFLVGDLKDNFSTTTTQDGNKVISFSATEEDIPVPVSLMISAAASAKQPEEGKMDKFPMPMKDMPLFEGMEEAHKVMPKLKDDVKILEVKFDITLDDNDQIVSNVFEFKVEGKDAEGINHEVVVKGVMNIADVNQTTVDTIDVSDKEVTVIDAKDFEEMEDNE